MSCLPFSLSPFISFFFSWPALRLFDTSKLLPPFFFSFRKTIVWETKSRVFFFEWKREIFLSTLRRRRRQKKNNTWGHGAGGPQTEIYFGIWKPFSLSYFFIFYYSFPVLQNFKGKILVVSFLITIFLPSVSYRKMSCCCGIEHLWKSSRCTVNNSKGDARRCPLLVGAWWSLFVWLYIAAQQKKRSEEEAEMTTIWKGNSNQLKLRNI